MTSTEAVQLALQAVARAHYIKVPCPCIYERIASEFEATMAIVLRARIASPSPKKMVVHPGLVETPLSFQ